MRRSTSRSASAASTLALALIPTLSVAACGSGGGPPPRPATGAPLAFEVQQVTPGDRGSIKVKAYNFADKTIAGYGVLMRYTDKSGQRVKVKAGTPFEKEFDFTSVSGRSFACKPKSWCSFELDRPEIPAAAAKAEAIPTPPSAPGPHGTSFEEPDLWRLDHRMDWPSSIP